MSRKINGIGASNGVSIAKIFKIENVEIEIDSKKIEDSEKEINILNSAIEKSVEQIEKIKMVASKTLSEEELEVFDAHIQMAKDPEMLLEVENLIKNENYNAAYAVDKVSQQLTQMFASFDDPYMRERAADIKDVSSRIIKAILNIETTDLTTIDEEVIIVADDLTPSDTAQLNKNFVKGFLTNIGGRTSHSAIMARSLEIPAILGLTNITELVSNGDIVAMNGETGMAIINPDDQEIEKFQEEYNQFLNHKKELEKFLNKVSASKDGKKVKIASNIGSVADAEGASKFNADAIGLFRSEFLYMDAENWPSEQEQFESYKAVLEKMGNKQVVVRTLDIGGDKTLKYFKFPEEMNPFLGYRAIRLSLDKKETFVTQLRALIRASAYGNLAIMFPMIATIDEFKQARAIYDQVYNQLKEEGHQVSESIEVGMMVEIPAAAVLTEQFCKYADFVSIGTNDLMQYTMAADRMSEKVSYLYQPLNPSILKLIKMTIDGAHRAGKWAGMCGEMAGDINAIPLLLGMGLDEFSMSSTSILEAKKLISEINFKDAHQLVHQALKCENQEQVQEVLNSFWENK
ncbi:phosphoenolpyruvate--protein phosphotransferase [Mesomycoplasma lagogenitalium]|uniref:Phosphoenolpyruvate-protein phosphotransferase n=1 Tax=Mesomycoplasma lagogenitalium TaxID=171286 RepID=A0ABY8LW17_9BACT|nr:phosphoenolpyruvate--protein phosphotransferase [Mesomycoplasma lagogenitalium]WGI36342.1 phosphoenolpyruvate--protein phosphotransferase [Mesomycoplasma lagogenitalium]